MAGNTQAESSNSTSLSNTSLSLATSLSGNLTFTPPMLNASAAVGNTNVTPSALLQRTTTSPQRPLTARLQSHLASWYQGLVNTTNYLIGIKASVPDSMNSSELSNTEKAGIDTGSDPQRARISRSLDQPADPEAQDFPADGAAPPDPLPDGAAAPAPLPDGAADPEVLEVLDDLEQVLDQQLEQLRLEILGQQPDVVSNVRPAPDLLEHLEQEEEAELANDVADAQAGAAAAAADLDNAHAADGPLQAQAADGFEARLANIQEFLRQIMVDMEGRIPEGPAGALFNQRLAAAQGQIPDLQQLLRDVQGLNRQIAEAVAEPFLVVEMPGPLPDVLDGVVQT